MLGLYGSKEHEHSSEGLRWFGRTRAKRTWMVM